MQEQPTKRQRRVSFGRERSLSRGGGKEDGGKAIDIINKETWKKMPQVIIEKDNDDGAMNSIQFQVFQRNRKEQSELERRKKIKEMAETQSGIISNILQEKQRRIKKYKERLNNVPEKIKQRHGKNIAELLKILDDEDRGGSADFKAEGKIKQVIDTLNPITLKKKASEYSQQELKEKLERKLDELTETQLKNIRDGITLATIYYDDARALELDMHPNLWSQTLNGISKLKSSSTFNNILTEQEVGTLLSTHIQWNKLQNAIGKILDKRRQQESDQEVQQKVQINKIYPQPLNNQQQQPQYNQFAQNKNISSEEKHKVRDNFQNQQESQHQDSKKEGIINTKPPSSINISYQQNTYEIQKQQKKEQPVIDALGNNISLTIDTSKDVIQQQFQNKEKKGKKGSCWPCFK